MYLMNIVLSLSFFVLFFSLSGGIAAPRKRQRHPRSVSSQILEDRSLFLVVLVTVTLKNGRSRG